MKLPAMSVRSLRFWAGLCVLLLSGRLDAGLVWDATEVEKQADPAGENTEVVFKFSNGGDRAVTITELKPACGCTTTELEKKTYAPGEKGEILAKFSHGDRQGLQSKTITVRTDDGGEPVLLTININIPIALDIRPVFVYWRKGEDPEPKVVTLSVGGETAVKIIRAESNNKNVSVDLESAEDGKSHRLTLFPATTADLFKARITIFAEYPIGRPRFYYVYAHVK